MSSVCEWARIVCVNVPGDDFITIGIVAWDSVRVLGEFTRDWDKIAEFYTGDANEIKEALEAVRRKVFDKRFGARDVEKMRKLVGGFRMLAPVPDQQEAPDTLRWATERYFTYVKPYRADGASDTGDF